MKNRIKKFESFEGTNNADDFSYELAEEFEKSNDYHIFRKHYTGTIREDIKNHDGNFAMSNQLTLNIFIDVVEYIKRLGYDIIKK